MTEQAGRAGQGEEDEGGKPMTASGSTSRSSASGSSVARPRCSSGAWRRRCVPRTAARRAGGAVHETRGTRRGSRATRPSTSRRRRRGSSALVKLSLIGGAALAAPVVFYQLWAFVAPGLYAKEKKYIIPFVSLSTILFVGGGYFAWRGVIPISFRYFLSLSNEGGSGARHHHPHLHGGRVHRLLPPGDARLRSHVRAADAAALPLHRRGRQLPHPPPVQPLVHLPRVRAGGGAHAPGRGEPARDGRIPLCLLYGLSIGLVYAFGKPGPHRGPEGRLPGPEEEARTTPERRRPQGASACPAASGSCASAFAFAASAGIALFRSKLPIEHLDQREREEAARGGREDGSILLPLVARGKARDVRHRDAGRACQRPAARSAA